MMYTSQFQKIDPYDWFCGPGPNVIWQLQKRLTFVLLLAMINKI